MTIGRLGMMLMILPGVALGQSMPGMTMDHAPSSGADAALMSGMDKMNKGMAVTMTGDADRDFVAMMIPHHQGAIDMAKVELQYGHDPVLRKLAEGIVAAQEKEIGEMKGWQRNR